MAAAFLVAVSPAGAQQPSPAFPKALPSSLPNTPAVSSPVPPSPIGGIRQAVAQDAPSYQRPGARDEYVDTDIQINTDIPSLQRLTRRDSEKGFFERLRQETRQNRGSERVPFPEEAQLTKEPFSPRPFPALVKYVEPSYVAHGRLTMEQPNWERAGWDVGFFQPGVCLASFYWDTLTMPYQMCKRPLQLTDTSAGKCLPGDPDPLVLYPPELSVTGMAGQAAAIATEFIAFPFWLVLR
jgi:hypothetical protein